MNPPGSGAQPTIISLSSTCATTGESIIFFTCNKAISSSDLGLELVNSVTGDVAWSGGFGGATNAQSFTIKGTKNGDYLLTADNGEATKSVNVSVDCAGSTPNCDLVLVSATPTPPTTVGGFGYVNFKYTTATQFVLGVTVSGPVTRAANFTNTGEAQVDNLPAGAYLYTIAQSANPDCQLNGSFTIAAPAAPIDPSLNQPARWEPVGGVLPNPVLLKVEAALTDALGAARPGLHVEVELWRVGLFVPFAEFSATIRTATQYVNAAPYLRAELLAAARYPGSQATPLIDSDSSLEFYYRYRITDAAGSEPWVKRAGLRYAVLAALPAAADTMLPFLADGAGRVASIFPNDEATQFVGLPLEVSVLLPTAATFRYAELRYLNAYGQELEIRSFALADYLPAGYLRIPLPADPLPDATTVEVAIVDTDRAHGPGTPPAAPGYLLTNTGRLKL